MNIPDRFWKGASVAAYLLVAFLAVLTIKAAREISYVGADTSTYHTINVEGTGDAIAVPDIATFSFTVSEDAKTVSEAQTAATEKTNAALKAVREAGIEDRDIKTLSYNINPRYEYQSAVCPARAPAPSYDMAVSSAPSVSYCPPGRSVLTGYEVSQTIEVKVRDLAKAGAIFTSIGSLEVEGVNGLNFSVDEPEAVQAEARAEAIEKAQAKAEALADQLGVRIVRIISFSENGSGYPRPLVYSMGAAKNEAADAVAPAPQVPTGEQKITSSVSITYEIR